MPQLCKKRTTQFRIYACFISLMWYYLSTINRNYILRSKEKRKMKNMKKITALVLALIMCLTLFAACGSSKDEGDKAYILDKEKMVIGYTVYEPMNYTDENGNFTGFDTELAKLVCEELGVEPEFVIINWDTKESELAGKSIDCIWNGMTLDAEREANMACSIPYCKNAQVVVVKNDFAYTDTSSLIGKTVCAEIGSAGESQLKGSTDDEGNFTPPEANLGQAEYVGKSVQTDCLLEVKAGTAQAAVLDMTLANSMIGEGTDYADLVIVDYLAEEDYGVAFRKGSDVRDEVNKIFDKLIKNGEMQKLADKYGLELAD